MHNDGINIYNDVGGAIRLITGDFNPPVSQIVVVMDLTGDKPKLLAVDITVDESQSMGRSMPLNNHLEQLKLTQLHEGKIITWKSLVLPPDQPFDSRPMAMGIQPAAVESSLLTVIDAHEPLGEGDPVMFDYGTVVEKYRLSACTYRLRHDRYYLTKNAPLLLFSGVSPGKYSAESLAAIVANFAKHATRPLDKTMLVVSANGTDGEGMVNHNVSMSYTRGCCELVKRHVDTKADSVQYYYSI